MGERLPNLTGTTSRLSQRSSAPSAQCSQSRRINPGGCVSEHFRTLEDYELFLYTLAERFPAVRRSTITFIRRGLSLARVAGELF